VGAGDRRGDLDRPAPLKRLDQQRVEPLGRIERQPSGLRLRSAS
jgi:hypothetical protein